MENHKKADKDIIKYFTVNIESMPVYIISKNDQGEHQYPDKFQQIEGLLKFYNLISRITRPEVITCIITIIDVLL